MISRRDFVRLLISPGITMSLSGCVASSLPLKEKAFLPENIRKYPFLGLAMSLPSEYAYETRVEGKIPVDLRGVLYRNTTGLLDRGGLRKRTLFDGDGMVQAFTFHDRGVHYKNRYVQTQKYTDETKAGAFLYPTFSTQAPGGMLANFFAGDKIKSQAQISVMVRNGILYAFDESAQPYALNTDTLETVGESYLGLPKGMTLFGAHSKVDPWTGEWFLFGLHYGRRVTLHITVFHNDGSLKIHNKVELPRYIHIHDFFVSDRHLLFHLHPLKLDVFGFLLGIRSMSESLRWEPEMGDLLLVIDRETLSQKVYLSTEATFSWHTINAYEKGTTMIADFIGYEQPDHMLGPDPPIYAVMKGNPGSYQYPGEIRRYIIDVHRKSISQEPLWKNNCEWPSINLIHRCHGYRYCYVANAQKGDFFWTGISRFDTMTSAADTFFYEGGLYCSEPVFVPKPDISYHSFIAEEPGWILTEVYNGTTHKSMLSVFDAEHISDGPIAHIHLRHHVPFSMHGFWYGRN